MTTLFAVLMHVPASIAALPPTVCVRAPEDAKDKIRQCESEILDLERAIEKSREKVAEKEQKVKEGEKLLKQLQDEIKNMKPSNERAVKTLAALALIAGVSSLQGEVAGEKVVIGRNKDRIIDLKKEILRLRE